MKWALRDPVRFLHEQDQFDKLLEEASWLKGVRWRVDPTLIVEVELEIEIHGSTYAMKLTYPELFPETPAYIRPRDTSHFWSGHQYGPGGVLCLEWRADNWNSQVTGADLVRSAYKLLSTERNPDQPGEVVSAHELTPGQELRSSEERFVCTPALMSLLESVPPMASRNVRTTTVLHKKTAVAFVSRFEKGDSMEEISDLPEGVRISGPLFAWRREGQLLKSEAFDSPTSIPSLDELAHIIQLAGFSEDVAQLRNPGNRLVLLVGTKPESLRVFAVSNSDDPTLEEYSVLLPEKPVLRLPCEHERLRELRIGIVGLGSLGSKVALSLARSGVRKFLLVDDDVLLPGNICRHALSWEAVGMHKAEAVREALLLIAPSMDIEVRAHRIAGQESALGAATALRDLTKCDLLIDATANPEAFLRLAAGAKASRCRMCWGEVFAGGLGGLIARARPGIDPHPAAVRSAILQHLQTLPIAPYREGEDYNTGGTKPVVAYDSEVGQLAAALSRFALDTAFEKESNCFPYSAYLIGFRREWIFSQPFDTHPIHVTGDGWDEVKSVSTEDRAEAIKILLHMLAEGQHVNAESSS